ncbi:MAG: hypothetical protein GF347_01010 [Candidatus Moranbacteria bacterium]|nr:hypothetical protein [Candidatus Moranbacteria bacterium]
MLESLKSSNPSILLIAILALFGLTVIISLVFIIKKILTILDPAKLIKLRVIKHFPSDCETMEEFNQKFKNCQAGAKITVAISKHLVYHYEILGKEGDRCKLKSFFVQNINPNLVKKEMYSLLDPKLELEQAVKKGLKTNSWGPLHDIMTGKKRDYE